MKLFVAFAFCFASAVNACTIEKLISDPVKEVVFDNKNNIHVISIRNSSHVVTMLDGENKVLQEIEKSEPVKESYFLKGKDKKVYFMVTEPSAESSQNNESCQAVFYSYSKENVSSGAFDNLICSGIKIFLDRDDTLYFNTLNGVFLYGKDQERPVPVRNLENYTFHHAIQDDDENVFLGSSEPNSLFVITGEERSSSKPSATRVPKQPNTPISKFVQLREVKVIAVYNKEGGGQLTGMTAHETVEFPMTYPGDFYGHFITRERSDDFYFTYTKGGNTRIALTPKAALGNYPSAGLPGYSIAEEGDIIAVDSRGHVYIPTTDGTLLHVQNGESPDLIPINMPNKYLIDDIALDQDENLWILANHLYRLSENRRTNGSLEEKSNLSFKGLGNSPAILKIKKGTKLYIGSESGLYTCNLF